ncbi:MAG: DUF4179 domain-containing protein [Lachnospiraceae bacterium]|nr:DUF4179 domain-containing protein [Lachnospiraceae bacterium]
MNYFDHVIKQIQQDNEVPHQVLERLEETLNDLPDCENSKAKPGHRWWHQTAAAAVVLGVGAVVCYSNPALAVKIPLIGKIFEKVEEDVPFSGDYSEKAESLIIIDSEQGKLGDTNEMTITDAGITVSASEIYCDGLSVFVTAQVRTEGGGLLNMPASHVVGKDTMVHVLHLDGTWQVSGESDAQTLMNHYLEGKVVDDYTFIGMMKFDMDERGLEQGTLNLQLSQISWDDTTVDNEQDLSAAHKYSGQWNFAIPFQADQQSVKEMEVGQEKEGYTIQKVFVSPYQIVTYVKAPTVEFEKNITRTDYEEKLGLQEGEEDPDMSYEEYVSQYGKGKQTIPCETVICNQDGELLPMQDMSTTSGTTVFAVNGKELSTLYIYVFNDGDEHYGSDGIIDRNMAADRSVVSAEVPIE